MLWGEIVFRGGARPGQLFDQKAVMNGDAQLVDQDVAVTADQDAIRAQPAVDSTVAGAFFEGEDHLAEQPHGMRRRERPAAGEDIGQRLVVGGILTDEYHVLAVGSHRRQGQQVGMADRTSEADIRIESVAVTRLTEQVGRQTQGAEGPSARRLADLIATALGRLVEGGDDGVAGDLEGRFARGLG